MKNIEAFRLRTEVAVDNAKAGKPLRETEHDVDRLGKRFVKLGKEINDSLKDSGVKGLARLKSEADSATSLITGSIQSLGQTVGSIIGTAIMPGIGTAIGSTVGSGVDAAMSKISGVILPRIQQGIELNKQLELTRVEFTTFAGSEQEADRYLLNLKKHAKDTGTDFNWVLDTSEHLFDLTNNLKLSDIILKAATDHAADFGGKVETIAKVAEALGLIAEKGGLASRELQKLYKLGIDAKKYLAEATGLTEKQIEKLMAEDRIRGDVAARLIAEGIEREKAGFAAKLTKTTTAGAERKFAVQNQLLAAEGTEKATKAIGDFYRSANSVLDSEGAHQFVQFIDQTTGSLIDLTKKGLSAGINVTMGLADGIVSGDAFRAVGSAVTSLGNYVETQFKSFFEINSPAELPRREIGVPIGEGIAQGTSDGFIKRFGQTKEEIIAELNKLLEDPRIQAFFEAIKKAEGGALNIMAGGRRVNSGALHPGEVVPKSQWFRGDKGPSSAAGFYQITRTNWRALTERLGLNNFSDPHQQMLAALSLFAERNGGAGLRALLNGDIDSAMAVAAKDWTSTPGSRIGGGRQIGRSRWLGYYNSALEGITANGRPITDKSPMPVAVVNWNVPDFNNAARIFGQQKPQNQTPTPDLSDYVMQLGDEDGAIVDVMYRKEQLIETDKRTAFEMRQLINTSSLVPRALIPLIGAEQQHADTAIKLTADYQEAARKQLVIGRSFLTQMSGAIGQIAGLMPQQQVGKKRGFWSKVLGFAAPFLSFIPGVGPILSQVAGMASAGLGGNWAGVATGLAGGLQPGGVFRSSGSGSASGDAAGKAEGRAIGGRGERGRLYRTGERGEELFVAPANGYFLTHSDAMRAAAGHSTNSKSAASFESAVDRLTALLSRLESMPAHEVVRMGARGVIDAFDNDAGLIRLTGQRLRLA